MKVLISFCLSLLAASLSAQQAVQIRVNAEDEEGTFSTSWAYFGYDEPNFTYMKDGSLLLSQLSSLSPAGIHVRTHNLLTTGDGIPALKWGSSNAYTEDALGRPVYDWTLLDKIFDAYHAAGITPFVEIGFMPKALSVHPEPYQHDWPTGVLWTGWAYPPKDYAKWRELIRRWALHSIERYGRKDVESWNWEVWNEPDIPYWQGRPEEYFRLYDFSADAVKAVLPNAPIGGPATTNPSSPKAAEFLKNFLAHCQHGPNYATGKTGAPLDFISFHAKGDVRMVDGHVRMDIGRHLNNIARGFEVVADSSAFRRLPVIVTESDPEGCAACTVAAHPELGYRNTSQYASYNMAVLNGIGSLAKRYNINLQGVLTWAFEFENQPYFAGLRALATRDIDLPVLDGFRMLGLMARERIWSESSGALQINALLNLKAQTGPDIGVFATRDEHQITVLVWNYQDQSTRTPPATIAFSIEGIHSQARQVLLEHYRVDDSNSNAYTAWKQMGSPKSPSQTQFAALKAAGELRAVTSPRFIKLEENTFQMVFELPSQGSSLIKLSW